MAFSNSYDFNLDIAQIIEEAYERCGLEGRTGHDLTTARHSLDLLLTEWANHQVNLWTIELDTKTVTDGTEEYSITFPIIDILDAVVRTSDNQDLPCERWSIEEYLQQPNKDTEARPTHFSLLRGETNSTLYLFPTPDTTYTFKFWSLNMIQDAGAYTNNVEVPRRFLPALCAGLAYKLSQKRAAKLVLGSDGNPIEVDGVSYQRRQELKAEYEQLFQEARYEDRDRASVWIVPAVGGRRS